MDAIERTVVEIAPKTWGISEFNLVNMFLLEGDEKAVLIDTGCGIGDFTEIIRRYTKKPLEVLLTHGHADHCGGMIYLKDHIPVYMNHTDKVYEKISPCTNGFRRKYINTRVPARFPGEGHVEALTKLRPPDDTPAVSFDHVKELRDGDEIDLGGRILYAINTPGHTDGSMCFLDRSNRIMFSGDTVTFGGNLVRQDDNDLRLVRQYHASLEKIWNYTDEFDRIAIGHDKIVVSKQLVKDYLDLTAGLLDGSIVGAYEEVGIRKGDVARLGMAELWYQCDDVKENRMKNQQQ